MKSRIVLIIFLFISVSSFAQTKFGINYVVGIPTGETSDYIDNTSWRGVNFDFSYFLKQDLAIGLSGGWQVFDEGRGFVTETTGTETISGYRYNYLNSIPLYGTSTYYFKTDKLSPYASLGVGVVYNELEQDIGLIQVQDDAWQFSLKPEIGLDYEVYYGLELRASLRYYYVAEAGDLPDLSYLGIGIGLVWGR